jgi:hypothetical protein
MRIVSIPLLLLLTSLPVAAGEDQFRFLTPSKNIACQFGGNGAEISAAVYCVRRDPNASTPEAPLLNAFVLLPESGKAKKGAFEGDPWYPADARILGYGKQDSDFGATCISRRTGLTCTRGKNGFSINSKSIKVF